jgi:hypothetical protein
MYASNSVTFPTADKFHNKQKSLVDAPGLLPILQDMSYVHPQNRITMITARDRIRKLRSNLKTAHLLRYQIPDWTQYPPVPQTVTGFFGALEKKQVVDELVVYIGMKVARGREEVEVEEQSRAAGHGSRESKESGARSTTGQQLSEISNYIAS